MNEIVVWVAVVLFSLGGLFALIRMVKGPSLLDRVIASDVVLAVLLGAVGLEIVINHHTTTLPVMLVLVMFAMVGSVSIARSIKREDQE